MNFHKTIGFLATLLLMVGLGVPDSFAQQYYYFGACRSKITSEMMLLIP